MLLKKSQFKIFNKLKLGRKGLSGINNSGSKTLYHRGGAVKKSIRTIDFKRYISNIPALIISFEYDPSRTCPIALLSYSNGAVAYALAVEGSQPGNVVRTTYTQLRATSHSLGDSSVINWLRPGLYLNCIETRPYTSATCVRAAGTFAKLVSIAKDTYAVIKLKSKTLLKININNLATVGALSAPFRNKIKHAGTSRRLGWRPHVRGVAMNPIDHPHGGGQGKTSGGRPSVSPWALTAKGGRTRKKIHYAKTIMKG